MTRERSPIEGRDRRHPDAYRALATGDVPAEALAALAASCGSLPAGDVFVVPPAARPTSASGQAWVASGWLAFDVGPLAVALWSATAADGPAGVRCRIAFEEIAAVEDERVLLYGRLTIHGQRARLRLRYSTVARPGLEPLLQAVRRQATGAPATLPPPALPRIVGSPAGPPGSKWDRLAASPAVLLDDERGIVVMHGRSAPGAAGGGGPALVAVTRREVVIAREPTADPLHNGYGVDILALPRRGLEVTAAEGAEIRFRSRGCLLALALDPGFAGCVRAELRPALEAPQSL